MGSFAVTLEKHDMQDATQVEIEEVSYVCQWSPEKVGLEEIGRACAAENTCKYGWMPNGQGGTMPRVKCIALSTRQIEIEEELAEVAQQ